MNAGTLVTFAVYLLAMTAIGAYFYRRNRTGDDFLLGNRKLPPFVTALSAQASDMSGWLLMGLPGAVFLGGARELWMVAGLFAGTWVNWRFVAPRLRERTAELGAITIPGFLVRRYGGAKSLAVTAAIVTWFFLTVYAASGLVASGLLFESLLGIRYPVAVAVGSAVVLAYTLLGGFLAVCWTDVVQGLMMLAALVVLPILAGLTPGPPSAGVAESAGNLQVPFSRVAETGLFPVLSLVFWGLGYFGQPHILVRFMAIENAAHLPIARRVAMVWVFLSLAGAVLVGFIGAHAYPSGLENPERVFIHLVQRTAGPWLGGILLAAILAAIMSTMDSQLLVASSALSEDLLSVGPPVSERRRLLWGRLMVAAVMGVALVLAMDPKNSVLGLVRYAWGGLGASFGPLVLFGLSSRRVSSRAALTGLCAGAATSILWSASGLGATLYEIVPGFAAGCLAILWWDRFPIHRAARTC